MRDHALTLVLCLAAIAFQSYQLHVFSQHVHEGPPPCPAEVTPEGGGPSFGPPKAARP